MDDYYVYVYIDPRNHEEFYYGKGRGLRKESHLQDDSDTEKTRRIKAIQDQGLNPIIRVIASKLSEHDALLIERTLLWNPSIIEEFLSSKDSANYISKEVKGLIARVLKGDDPYNQDEWEQHREEYWTDDEIEEVLRLCV